MLIFLITTPSSCRRVKFFLFLLCFMAISILPINVFGEMSRHITILPEEMVSLPKWCQIRMLAHPKMFGHADAGDVPDSVMRENARWATIIGEDIYGTTHHYCRGLNWLNRYRIALSSVYKGAEADRKFAINQADGDFRYMRSALTPKHKLYYPMLMNEAYIFQEKKDINKALRNYSEIMQRKPSYALAYVKYAEILKSVGEKEEAVRVLKLGLKKTNDDPIIKKALNALEGTSTVK